ncbi:MULTISPECIES: DUF2528 family protein [Serratia]|uniref:DUF2528 family protein n=1 Tax=Serratia TaxID=613 RepID=UPI0025AA6B73|nr:DUF2528 family protein [Serratia marcescens]MDN0028180.1 DUF2528 family protein [Serratia marcescens]
MNTIKRYDIIWAAHEDGPALTVEIDPAVCTLDTLYRMNEAFEYADERLAENDGNLLLTVLKMLGAHCFHQAMNDDWLQAGLYDAFRHGHVEGWPPLDGSEGITIINCDAPSIHYSKMYVSEVA